MIRWGGGGGGEGYSLHVVEWALGCSKQDTREINRVGRRKLCFDGFVWKRVEQWCME